MSGKRLTDSLNSAYLGAAQRMRPRGSRRRIVAYVESFDDVLFWRGVLSHVEDKRVCFEVMLPSRTSLAKGKKVAITNILGGKLGDNMIACVDADYDYLMQGAGESSRIVCSNPYVFHTYPYAIENFQCYAPSLHGVCVMATLNDREAFDFESFLRDFSVVIHPLFVWNIWCYRTGNFKTFSMANFCSVFALGDVNVLRPERAIAVLRRRVNRTISWLQRTFPQAREQYTALREELVRLGVRPENTYMYIRGHDIFDAVVSPLVAQVCEVLRREREREIRRLAVNDQQMQGELASYQHSISPSDFMLRKQNGFTDAPEYRHILEDVKAFVARIEKDTAREDNDKKERK